MKLPVDLRPFKWKKRMEVLSILLLEAAGRPRERQKSAG